MSENLFSNLIVTHGIILETERFEECVKFYRDTLELPLWYEKLELVCLRFGTGYLMIETGGTARDKRKASNENPTTLRFNVSDVEAAAKHLRNKNVAVDVTVYSWGKVGTFLDPTGNACDLKNADDPFFQN